jgi:hypothetical protein
MQGASFQYRNNDPSENVEVAFTGKDGITRVISFVATRPHWCEEKEIFGDLFSSPLGAVFEGAVYPLIPGSPEEDAVIRDFRVYVESAIPDFANVRQRQQPKMSEAEGRDRCMVWFLAALENRRDRFVTK